MDNQEILLKKIRTKLAPTLSINDEIATVLNISYDAAHRRVSGKSKFSIDQTVALANHYNLSLDELFFKKDKIIIEKTIEIHSLKDLRLYFEQSATAIEKLTANKNTTLYYSAKDIPLFYFMDATLLSKFKAYVWLSLLENKDSKIAFEHFVIDESFSIPMQKLKKSYENSNVKEVWNDTTINSSLQQILYFYESGLLTYKSATKLFFELKKIIENIKSKCNNTDYQFSIYYNELILLNNNLLFDTNKNLTLFVPYTLLGYFISTNLESCQNVHRFFDQQIENSKHLNQAGFRDQNLFFNRMNQKIDYYIDRLNKQVDLLF